jgi:tRNA(Ile2) C34 agmatinyltransferase TiaS
MVTNEPPRCNRCGGTTKYGARINLPPRDVYHCESCGNDMLDDRFHETGRHGTGDLFMDSPFGFDRARNASWQDGDR